ncbi:MAG: cytochrome-c oxidase, cbb3-type subunit I [Candidatus Dadabacteria bacterium]|nr:MAG: cytochrome-c oxidase, cbb3-type subunit I [Candidatus Dadabacteria bacterium]
MEKFRYDDRIVRHFVLATIVWGIVGMLVGLVIALQLADWKFNFGIPWLTFGRLRPLHTNAVIFAFAGNAIFAGIYYSTQRLLKARMWSDALSAIHFWGWQLIIISAAVTLPLGITVSKEYAELEWPIDIAIAIVWVVFGVNFFMTLARRRERHIYVAVWFYIATIITIAMLHIVNSLEIPVSFLKSYSIFAGVQDALVQWWYGHNAVAFFLTTPFLGLMYYFIPKAAERPVYSYRLSIVHFWSLIFIYIWAGPHHLLNLALPDWLQTMGVIFSVTLIAPSWGGMINGLLTLRGAWDKLRTDPILKFLVVGVTFYGMSTFEGPMMSIRAINSLTHYTDYTIGHVHGGALGWNGFIAFGMIYYLVPKLWKRPMFSQKLMLTHFWMSTVGIVLYITSMWTAGITQGLMWWAFTEDGMLKYPEFVETVVKLVPFYWIRFLGGGLYFIGVILLGYNVLKTIRLAAKEGISLDDTEAQAPPLERKPLPTSIPFHHRLEAKAALFSLLVLIAVLIGGPAEYIPLVAIKSNIKTIPSVKPYTPLELEGRDIYIREGCYLCHSQMIRPFRDEVLRYGEYSKAGEFVYDHPFQFGSRRIGPDLHRVGGKYPDFWHYKHMKDPRSTTSGSIMPPYPWLYKNDLDTSLTVKKLSVMKKLGVPYSDDQVKHGVELLKSQAKEIVNRLKSQGAANMEGMERKEIIALIAYLQRLGTDIRR